MGKYTSRIVSFYKRKVDSFKSCFVHFDNRLLFVINQQLFLFGENNRQGDV